MAKKEEQHALYMMKKDGDKYARAELIPADQVEDKRKEGYVEPIGQKANGEEWNDEDDLVGQDAAADMAELRAERDAKKQEKKTEELEEQRKANEKQAEAQQDAPDFKVQVVEPPKKVAKKK